jgi:hypothetical protein
MNGRFLGPPTAKGGWLEGGEAGGETPTAAVGTTALKKVAKDWFF